jgi:phage shock protein C
MEKRLYRSRRSRIIGGICGGLGEYFNIDPVIVRLVWFVLIIFGGIGILAYIIAWVIIPDENVYPAEKPPQAKETISDVQKQGNYNARIFWGVVLIILGVLFGIREFWYFDDIFRDLFKFFWRYFIPALLIILGIYVIVKGEERAR